MKTRNLLCQATVILFAFVCLASAGDIPMEADNIADVSGSGNRISQNIGMNANSAGGGDISQDADNRANIDGSGNRVDQNIHQNAGSGVIGLVVPGVIQPVSSLQQRVQYSGQWILGPATVCLDRSLDTVIKNNRNQYLRTYEIYPNGQMFATDMGYHAAGEMVYGAFVGDKPGLHKLRARGSISGWSNDILMIQVVPCYLTGGYIAGGVTQDADNWANVGGRGNRVDQDIDQNAWSGGGGDIWQDADNTANVDGSGNQVDQNIDQNAWA